MGPLPKMKTSRFFTLLSKWSSRALDRPLEHGIGPLSPKIRTCQPSMDPPKHVTCLFSSNVVSDRLQYLIIRIENEPQDQRGREISPLYSHGCATALRGWGVSTSVPRGQFSIPHEGCAVGKNNSVPPGRMWSDRYSGVDEGRLDWMSRKVL